MLDFAAGATIFVVVEELIPESQVESNTDVATIGAMLGFAVMMLLDVAPGYALTDKAVFIMFTKCLTLDAITQFLTCFSRNKYIYKLQRRIDPVSVFHSIVRHLGTI